MIREARPWRYPAPVPYLANLSPMELAMLVQEAFLADCGEFDGSSARDFDTLMQLRGYLHGRPALAGYVLDLWLAGITGEEAAEMRAEAEAWFDRTLLGAARFN